MNTHPRCDQYNQSALGFTLVEVLVAAAILAVGLMGVASMIGRSTIQDARAYHTSHASVMVEEFIESESVKQSNNNLYRQINGTNGTVTRTISGVTYSMNCTVTANTPIDNCREMNCTVRWNNKGLQSQTEYIYVFAPKY